LPNFDSFFFSREVTIQLVILRENSKDGALNGVLDNRGILVLLVLTFSNVLCLFIDHVEKLLNPVLNFLSLLLRGTKAHPFSLSHSVGFIDSI